jgi:hypothetical protein
MQRIADLEAELLRAQCGRGMWMKYYAQSELRLKKIAAIVPTALVTGSVTMWEALTAIQKETVQKPSDMALALRAFRGAVIDRLIKTVKAKPDGIPHLARPGIVAWLVLQRSQP